MRVSTDSSLVWGWEVGKMNWTRTQETSPLEGDYMFSRMIKIWEEDRWQPDGATAALLTDLTLRDAILYEAIDPARGNLTHDRYSCMYALCRYLQSCKDGFANSLYVHQDAACRGYHPLEWAWKVSPRMDYYKYF
jgi:hypothetical protein